jgi:hypothetical protein
VCVSGLSIPIDPIIGPEKGAQLDHVVELGLGAVRDWHHALIIMKFVVILIPQLSGKSATIGFRASYNRYRVLKTAESCNYVAIF